MIERLRHSLREKFDEFFCHREWNIGIVHEPIQSFLALDARPEVHWFPPPKKGVYLADPFAARRGGEIYVLLEEFDYRTRKGTISSLELSKISRPPETKVAIELPVHMSYPYLFEHEGEFYCVPETSQAREICLYRAQEFPLQWVKVATLVKDVAAVDSTIFQYEGRWWLACTDNEAGPDRRLYIWHAPDLPGPWKPHVANPVKDDITSARPAGAPFVQKGILYRPAQDSSRIYGGRIVINRIVKLTPSEFSEVQAAVIEPFRGTRYPEGVHTVSYIGNITLVDGFRFTCIRSVLKEALRREFTRLRGSISALLHRN